MLRKKEILKIFTDIKCENSVVIEIFNGTLSEILEKYLLLFPLVCFHCEYAWSVIEIFIYMSAK